jgi:hypothetical protein
VLAIPTLAIHWALGHINWALAGEFAAGQIPGSAAGSRFAHHVQGPVVRRAFGWFLIAFVLSSAGAALAAMALADLAADQALGWWWADPAAASLIALFLLREGWRIRGEPG